MPDPPIPSARIVDRGAVAVARRAGALAFGLGVALSLLEASLLLTGAERRAVSRALYYQGADVQLHEVSPDPALLYELRPGASGPSVAGGVAVRVDRYGARGPARPAEKPPGTYRILFFGASTLYGAGLEEGETMSAVLQRHLDADVAAGGRGAEETPRRRYEVWNFGVSGYVLSQMAARARARLGLLDPDLVLVLYSNHTRRPFLAEEGHLDRDHLPLLRADDDLFLENLPSPDGVGERLHLLLLHRSSLYRYARALARSQAAGTHERGNRRAELASSRQVAALEAESARRGVTPVYAIVPAWRGRLPRVRVLPGIPDRRVIDLFEGGHDLSWYEEHPPAPVMEEHTRILSSALVRRNLLGRPAAGGGVGRAAR